MAENMSEGGKNTRLIGKNIQEKRKNMPESSAMS
jgi:hypothetical protein